MAATIVSTPATGSSDWTGWITQQGLTDRGFMQVSLTNFATTAASLIGTGSIFELAGSIYSCTETAISLAAGTISAAVAVYYVAIPSAGGTTCTFTMDSVAPTWVDAKQGYYASAASTSRYLGGTYIGTAATYYDKWLYDKPKQSNVKIGSVTRSTAGDQVISGVGFRPSVIIFSAVDNVTANVNNSLGFSNLTLNYVQYTREDGTEQNSDFTECIYIQRDISNKLRGTVLALSEDGFTFRWTLNGACGLVCIYLALP